MSKHVPCTGEYVYELQCYCDDFVGQESTLIVILFLLTLAGLLCGAILRERSQFDPTGTKEPDDKSNNCLCCSFSMFMF